MNSAKETSMTWEEILAETLRIEDEWRSGGLAVWYRGHADAGWELKSTLHRHVEKFMKAMTPTPAATDWRVQLREEYKTQYRRFRADAWPLLDLRELSDWGIVFAMQHYGQLTRLLDWTESLACAVYFALFRSCAGCKCCEKCDCCDPEKRTTAIWMLEPRALNEASINVTGIIGLDNRPTDPDVQSSVEVWKWHPRYGTDDELKTIAVAPDFTNARMTAQRAAFTMSGDSFDSLDVEAKSVVQAGRLRKYVLSPTACKDAAVFLKRAGLTAYSVFPDLHGLALRLKDETRKQFTDGAQWYPKNFKP